MKGEENERGVSWGLMKCETLYEWVEGDKGEIEDLYKCRAGEAEVMVTRKPEEVCGLW